jgi:hypothetical protein
VSFGTRVRPLATKCNRGHPYDEANTYTDPGGHRYCVACRRARRRIHQHGHREHALIAFLRVQAPNDELSRIRIPTQPLVEFFEKRGISPRATFHPSTLRQIDRAKSLGYISMGYADALCGVFSVHPGEIWGYAEWNEYGEEAS